MRYSINLRHFAKRAQITFGAIAKGNLLTFAMCLEKEADFFKQLYESLFWVTLLILNF
jgi:hypothetical protein